MRFGNQKFQNNDVDFLTENIHVNVYIYKLVKRYVKYKKIDKSNVSLFVR